MGTGGFGLAIDTKMIMKEAQDKDQFGANFEEMGEDGLYLSPSGSMTPIQADSQHLVDDIINQNAASMYAATSHRSAYTPGYDLGFSPNDNQYGSPAFYASPAHCQSSPGYGSPIGVAGTSPIYAGMNAQ